VRSFCFLEAFDALTQVCEFFLESSLGLLQNTNTAIELRVRELDHRLRLCEAKIHTRLDGSGLTVQFLVE